LPGLFDAITDMLPTKARVVSDLRSNRYNVHFAKVEPGGSGAATHQGRLNSLRRSVEYSGPHFAQEPVLSLTRPECATLYDALGSMLGKTPDQTLNDRLKAANDDLANVKQGREDAVKVNTRLTNEANRHKNDLRDAQARLAQMTEIYHGLLDRLSSK
jgi:hypothetical protein